MSGRGRRPDGRQSWRGTSPTAVYTAVLTALSLVAVAFQTGRWVSAPVAEALGHLSASATGAVVIAAGSIGLGAWLTALHFLGPVGVDRPTQRWRIPPGSAAPWLRVRVEHRRILLLAAAAVAAVWVGFTLPATALVAGPCAALVFVMTGSSGLAAIFAQQHDAAVLVGGIGIAMILLGIALFLLVTAPPGLIPLSGAAAVAVHRAAIRPETRVWRKIRRAARAPDAVIPRWELTRGAESLDAVSTAAVYLESRPMTSLRYRRAASMLVRLRVPRMPAPLTAAWVTGRRSLSTTRLPALLGLAGLPAGFAAVGTEPVAAALVLTLTVAISIGAGTSLEHWLDSAALRRTIPIEPAAGAIALGAPVAAMTSVFAAVAAAAAGLGGWWIAAAGATAVLAHVRRWRARSVPGKIGPVITTEMGAIPLGIVSRVIAGSDAVALAAVLALIGISPAALTVLMTVAAGGYLLRLRFAREVAHS